MKTTNMPFTHYVQVDEHVLWFNCPPESIKRIKAGRLPLPSIIVIGDTAIHQNIALCSPEFLFLGKMFMGDGFDFVNRRVKNPLYLVGDKSRVDAFYQALRQAFLSLTPKEMQQLGIRADICDQLAKNANHLALKGPGGEIIPFSDYVKCAPFVNKNVRVDNVKITHVSRDSYRVECESEVETIVLTSGGTLAPIWAIPYLGTIEFNHAFSVYVLGSDSGFAPNPSTGYLFEVYNQYYLWDCPPFCSHILEKNGIHPGQIEAIFISHVHGDHFSDLIPFALNGYRRTELISTREILYQAKQVLSALMGMPIKRVERLFNWREINTDEPVTINGCVFTVRYGFHPIPSLGVTVYKDGKHRISLSGDTGFDSVLRQAEKDGVITAEYREKIESMIEPGRLVLVDAGDAVIHGKPADFIDEGDRTGLHLYHLSNLPKSLMIRFNIVRPGYSYVSTESKGDVFNTPLISNTLQKMGVKQWSRWASRFGIAAEIIRFEPDQLIVQSGSSELGYFYIIIHGFVGVFIGEHLVATLNKGEYFGEQALITKQTRNADILSTTICQIMIVPASVFNEMLEEEARNGSNILSVLKRTWEYRIAIARVKEFSDLPTSIKNTIAQNVLKRNYRAGDTVITINKMQSEVYVIVSGSVEIQNNDLYEKNPIFNSDSIISKDTTMASEGVDNVRVVALEETLIYIINGETMDQLKQDIPWLSNTIGNAM